MAEKSRQEIIREKLGYPIINSAGCPNCGSFETDDEELVKLMEEFDVVEKNTFKDGCFLTVQFVNPSKPPKVILDYSEVPILQIFFHECKLCHTLYAHKLNFGIARAPAPKMPGPPMPRGFGRG
jgi:hypothetical protein